MSKYLNPFLNSTPIQQRKQRSDKLHDIKVPVSEEVHEYVSYQAARKGLSVTKLCTYIVKKTINSNSNYVQIDYLRSNLMVHVHLNSDDYQRIRILANDWKCSVREATYIVFHYGLRAVHL